MRTFLQSVLSCGQYSTMSAWSQYLGACDIYLVCYIVDYLISLSIYLVLLCIYSSGSLTTRDACMGFVRIRLASTTVLCAT